MKLPKLSFKLLRNILLLSFLASGIFSLGFLAGRAGINPSLDSFPNVTISREVPAERGNLDFSLFWRVWDTLQERYYDDSKLVPAKMVYGAIAGMVAAVEDPYTVFLAPQENKIVQEDLQGNFEGIGIQIGFKGTQLAVIAPLAGSPAEKGGIKAGDYIIGIKDEGKDVDRGTVGITLPEAVQAIRGDAGSKVTLTILREGTDEPFVVDVIRESINVPSVVVEFINDGKVAHLKVLKFGAETEGEWDRAVANILRRSEVEGIVLDLRNNPGGYLQGAVDLAGDFLDSGSVVVVEESGNGNKEEFKSQGIPRLKNYNVVVLVNEGSASASEILAGALRDINSIRLVGETTFGKGTIQEPQQINGGAGLHITIAKWLTPLGIWVNDSGLKPDLEIADNAETEGDEQLDEATKLVLGN